MVIKSSEGINEYGEPCWNIFEHDEQTQGLLKIATYATREEAVAFTDGINWPEDKKHLTRLKFKYAEDGAAEVT